MIIFPSWFFFSGGWRCWRRGIGNRHYWWHKNYRERWRLQTKKKESEESRLSIRDIRLFQIVTSVFILKGLCMCLEGSEGGWGSSNLRLLWTSCVRTEMCVMHLYVMILFFYFIFYKFQIVKFLCFRIFFLEIGSFRFTVWQSKF